MTKEDGRYQINLEYCGYSVPMYIVRFCDERIGCCRDQTKARHVADTHRKEWLKSAGII